MSKIPENVVSIDTVYANYAKRERSLTAKPSVPIAVENDSGLIPVDVFLRKLAARLRRESFFRFSSNSPSDDAS